MRIDNERESAHSLCARNAHTLPSNVPATVRVNLAVCSIRLFRQQKQDIVEYNIPNVLRLQLLNHLCENQKELKLKPYEKTSSIIYLYCL